MSPANPHDVAAYLKDNYVIHKKEVRGIVDRHRSILDRETGKRSTTPQAGDKIAEAAGLTRKPCPTFEISKPM